MIYLILVIQIETSAWNLHLNNCDLISITKFVNLKSDAKSIGENINCESGGEMQACQLKIKIAQIDSKGGWGCAHDQRRESKPW